MGSINSEHLSFRANAQTTLFINARISMILVIFLPRGIEDNLSKALGVITVQTSTTLKEMCMPRWINTQSFGLMRGNPNEALGPPNARINVTQNM